VISVALFAVARGETRAEVGAIVESLQRRLATADLGTVEALDQFVAEYS
jgi:hypothetical protein